MTRYYFRRPIAAVLLSGLLILFVAPAATAVTPVKGVVKAMELTGLDQFTAAIALLAHREITLVASDISDATQRKRFIKILDQQFSGETLSRLVEIALLNGYDSDIYETVIDQFSVAFVVRMHSLDAECRKLTPIDKPLEAWRELRSNRDATDRRQLLSRLADDSRSAALTNETIMALENIIRNIKDALLEAAPRQQDGDAAGQAAYDARQRWMEDRDAAWMAWCYRNVGRDDLERLDQLYRRDATAKLLDAYRAALAGALVRMGQRTTDRLNF